MAEEIPKDSLYKNLIDEYGEIDEKIERSLEKIYKGGVREFQEMVTNMAGGRITPLDEYEGELSFRVKLIEKHIGELKEFMYDDYNIYDREQIEEIKTIFINLLELLNRILEEIKIRDEIYNFSAVRKFLDHLDKRLNIITYFKQKIQKFNSKT